MTADTMEELIENFSLFDDWEERYRYLIDLGQNLPSMDESLKTDDRIVRGCTSRVWLATRINQNQDGQACLSFVADSDAMIVRGLIAILMVAYNNRSKEEIGDVDIDKDFEALGLSAHLSPSRRNGFFAMVERIKLAGDGL